MTRRTTKVHRDTTMIGDDVIHIEAVVCASITVRRVGVARMVAVLPAYKPASSLSKKS